MGTAHRPVPAKAETGAASKPNQLRISYIGCMETVGMNCSRLGPLDAP